MWAHATVIAGHSLTGLTAGTLSVLYVKEDKSTSFEQNFFTFLTFA